MTKIVHPTEVGQKCRIILSKKPVELGDTLWEITAVSNGHCSIREVRENSEKYRSQDYYLSMLCVVEA